MKVNAYQLAAIVAVFIVLGFFAYQKFLKPKPQPTPFQWSDITVPK